MSAFRVERDEASGLFFEAAASGQLLIRRCPACGTAHPPQTRRCVDSNELEWVAASGKAVLITWAVDHVAPLDPLLASPAGDSSVFGIVELEEGPWWQVPIVGVDASALHEGIAMQVTFVRPGLGETIPAFTRP